MESTEIEAVPFLSSILNLQSLSIYYRTNASNQQKKQLQHRGCALVASEASAKLQQWHGRPKSTQCGCGTEWPCEKADSVECFRHVYRRPFEPRAMEGIAARRSPALEIRKADVPDRIQRTARPTSGICSIGSTLQRSCNEGTSTHSSSQTHMAGMIHTRGAWTIASGGRRNGQ